MKLDFAEVKKRVQARSALAVTLESARVVVDLVRVESGASRVMQSFVLPLGSDTVAAAPDKAGAELAAALAAAGIRERRCVVCIPPGWALTTSADVPEIGAEDLRGYLELRAEREFPIAVSDLRLAHCAYNLPGGKQRATLAAVPAKKIAAVERMLEVAGCRAVSLSLGLDACVARGEQSAALHFLANGNHVDVVIAAGGGIAAVRSLDGAAAAGEPKFDAGIFSREVRITLGGLPDEVRQQVRAAHFSGAPAAAEMLCLELREPLQRMGIDSKLDRTSGAHENAGAARETAGRHLRKQPVAFEFVVPQVNRWQTVGARFETRQRRWMLGAAVAVVLLPIVIFFVRSHIESSLETEWNGMRRNVAELENLQQRIRKFRPWFEPAPQSLQALEGLASAFPEQGDVWAKSIQLGENGKVTCSGFARNEAALGAFFERLRSRPDVSNVQRQQLRGENPIQFSFTYKWTPRDAK